ncbi:Rho guanine nucleotide exchange factor 3, variant 3 [Balamuthia mandrillaris]
MKREGEDKDDASEQGMAFVEGMKRHLAHTTTTNTNTAASDLFLETSSSPKGEAVSPTRSPALQPSTSPTSSSHLRDFALSQKDERLRRKENELRRMERSLAQRERELQALKQQQQQMPHVEITSSSSATSIALTPPSGPSADKSRRTQLFPSASPSSSTSPSSFNATLENVLSSRSFRTTATNNHNNNARGPSPRKKKPDLPPLPPPRLPSPLSTQRDPNLTKTMILSLGYGEDGVLGIAPSSRFPSSSSLCSHQPHHHRHQHLHRESSSTSTKSPYVLTSPRSLQASFGKEDRISFVAAGLYVSAAVTEDGKLFTWGKKVVEGVNLLGHGESSEYHIPNGDEREEKEENEDIQWEPLPVSSLNRVYVLKVAVGTYHMCCLTADQQVFSWGCNKHGQCGLGEMTDKVELPVCLSTTQELLKVTDIACGEHHTCCITSEGDMFAFGSSDFGQLGLGDTNKQFYPKRILDIPKATSVACGANHTAFITDKSEVYTMGDSLSLGLPTAQPQLVPSVVKFLRGKSISQISCSRWMTAALTETGDVYTWGYRFFKDHLQFSSLDALAKAQAISNASSPRSLQPLSPSPSNGTTLSRTQSAIHLPSTPNSKEKHFGDKEQSSSAAGNNTSPSFLSSLFARKATTSPASPSPSPPSSLSSSGSFSTSRSSSPSSASSSLRASLDAEVLLRRSSSNGNEVIPRLLNVDNLAGRSIRYISCGGCFVYCVTDQGDVLAYAVNLLQGNGGDTRLSSSGKLIIRKRRSTGKQPAQLAASRKASQPAPSSSSASQEAEKEVLSSSIKRSPSQPMLSSLANASKGNYTVSSLSFLPFIPKVDDIVALRNIRTISANDNHVLFMFDEQRSRRDTMAWDLLKSERSYVRMLNIIVKIFYKPLLSKITESSAHNFQTVTLDLAEAIFSNVEEILLFQRKLLNQLDCCLRNWAAPQFQLLGNVFVDMKDMLPLYTRYCANTANALSTLQTCCTNRSFISYLQECEKEAATYRKVEDGGRDLSLGSLIMEPTIRIHKYLSYFKEILATTPQNHPDYANLQTFELHLIQIVKKLDDDQNQNEYMQLVAGIKGLKQLMQPSRKYVAKIPITVLLVPPMEGQDRSLLLYNDLLCICSKTQLEHQLPLKHLWIKTKTPVKENTSTSFTLIGPEKVLVVAAHTEQIKHSFLSAIQIRLEQLLGKSDFDVGNDIRDFEYTFANGATYKGQWQAGKFHGKGTFIKTNTESYEGEWAHGKRQGYGVYTKKDSRFEGHWKKDKRHGQGVQHYHPSTGFTKYVGYWVDDKRNDEGYLYFENGNIFVCKWNMGAVTMPCTLIYANGDRYVGSWQNKQPQGYGIKTYASHETYYGCWAQGVRSGLGFLRLVDGTIYNGEWVNNRIQGKGHLLVPNKYVIEGRFAGESLDRLDISGGTWMKSIPRDIEELNMEKWNNFFVVNFERDVKNEAAKRLDEFFRELLKTTTKNADEAGMYAILNASKNILSNTSHPLGAVVQSFVDLFSANYGMLEEAYKCFTDVLDDAHSFIESLVHNMMVIYSTFAELEEGYQWCTRAVETTVYAKLYPTLFSLFKMKHIHDDKEMVRKLERLRKLPLDQQFVMLEMDANLLTMFHLHPNQQQSSNRKQKSRSRSFTDSTPPTRKTSFSALSVSTSALTSNKGQLLTRERSSSTIGNNNNIQRETTGRMSTSPISEEELLSVSANANIQSEEDEEENSSASSSSSSSSSETTSFSTVRNSRGEMLPFQAAIRAMSKMALLRSPEEKLNQILLASKEIEHQTGAPTS